MNAILQDARSTFIAWICLSIANFTKFRTNGTAMKKFEILVTAYRAVIIEAEDKEDAMEIDAEECRDFDWEIDAWNIERELETEDAVKASLRHGAKLLEDW